MAQEDENGENRENGEKGDARMKLVDSVVNTPDEQLSSMTNIQPNLVTPLAMTETYETLTDILKRYVGRYSVWLEKHKKWLDAGKARAYLEAKQEGVFICPLCVADGKDEKESKHKGNGAYKINFDGVWSKGIIGPQVYTEVDEEMVLCFEHAISMVERVQWGPPVMDEEVKLMDEEDAKVSVHLTKIYRMSLYKHRRSVGGVQRMAVIDLSKEQMALESSMESEKEPDFED